MNPNNKERFHSIRLQVAASIMALILAVVLFACLANSLFLDRIYQREKIGALQDAFSAFDEASQNETLYTQEYAPKIETICANENLSLIVMTSNGSVVLTSSRDNDRMIEQLFSMMLGGDNDSHTIITKDSYSVRRGHEEGSDNEYLVLTGTLSDGNIILIRSSIAGMRDSARISNRFFILIGIVAALIGSVTAWFLSRRMTRPIQQLAELSERMKDLDFEAKYVPRKHKNEIDLLGGRMNELSGTLYETIGELKQANSRLQRDIAVREENERMRREFVSNISHELKTPLALIMGYAEGLKEGVSDDPESVDFYTDVIIDESRKMDSLVKSMLALNRLEYGSETIQMERFDLNGLIRDQLSSLSLPVSEAGIRLETDLCKDPCFVWSDASLLGQVISNYLSNAIHYAAGEKRITVKSEETEDKLCVHVINTGEPVPAEKLPHIWEKFYKVDEARTREYGGSGIGLSVVKAVMEALSGTCGADILEDGMDFWFDLEK